MLLDKLVVAIEADIGKLRSGLAQGSQEISKFGGGVASMTAKATAGSTAVAAAIGASAVALGFIAKKGIDMASDLQEVQNVVDVTFGKSAEEINKWAKSAGDSFGLSELQAKKMTGTMGAMLKSMDLTGPQATDMSKNLAGLTGDMSSFYNLPHEEMFTKIRSGMAGETEGLKALGINMSQTNLQAYALSEGIKKPLKEMSQGELTQLRYGYLMKVTADAQGDFARTSKGYANQQRVMTMRINEVIAAIGARLLPIVTKLTNFFNEKVLPAVTDFIKNFDLSKIDPSVLSGIAGAVMGALVPALIAGATALWAMFAPLIPFIAIGALVGVAIDALVRKFGGWGAMKDRAVAAIDAIKTAFQFLVDGFNGGGDPAALTGPMKAIYDAGVELRSVFEPIKTVAIALFEALKAQAGPVMEMLKDSFDKFKESMGPAMDSLKNAWNQLKPALTAIAAVIGLVVVTSIAVFIGVINGLIRAIGPLLRAIGGIVAVVVGVFNLLVGIFTGDGAKINAALAGIGQGIKDTFGGLWGAIVGFLGGFVDGVVGFFTGLYDTLVGHSIIPDMVNGIISWIAQLPGRAIAFVVALVTSFISKVMNLKTQVSTGIMTMVTSVIGFVAKLPGRIGSFVSSMVSGFVAKVSSLKSAVTSGFSGLVSSAISTISRLPGAVLSIGSRMYNAGAEIVRQLIQGLKNKIAGAVTVIKNAASSMMRFLPQSPAKEGPLRGLTKVGAGFMGQLEKGFDAVDTNGIMNKISNGMNVDISGAMYGRGAPLSSTSSPSQLYGKVEIHLHGTTIRETADIDLLAERLQDKIDRTRREQGGT